MKTGCIYMITNTINGKCYVGQTLDFARRRFEHEQGRGRHPIARAFRKYGKAAFVWQVIADKIPASQLDRLEAAAIHAHGTLVHRGYNVLAGGASSPRTADMLERQRAGIRRKTQTPEWREKNLRQLQSMHASPEWHRKHDAAMARNPRDPEWRRKHAEIVSRMCRPVRCVDTDRAST